MTPTLSRTQKAAILLLFSGILSRKKKRRRTTWAEQNYRLQKKFTLVKMMKVLNSDHFRKDLRMNFENFSLLLNMVRPLVEDENTFLGDTVSAEERLFVTLKFLASGCSYEELVSITDIPSESLSRIVPDTCKAIVKCLKQYMKMPSTEEWESIASEFKNKWDFCNCIGAMCGKHIAIKEPTESEYNFKNYKNFCSIIILAVVNANYEFIYVDVGGNGSLTDGMALRYTQFYEKLIDETLSIPNPKPLPNTNISVPYVFVADRSIEIIENIVVPFPSVNISEEQRIFNYRLSRARQVADNTFGILASRFKLLQCPISVHINDVNIVVLACCALHNYLIKTNKNYIRPSRDLDTENISQLAFRPAKWRKKMTGGMEWCDTHPLVSLCPIDDKKPLQQGIEVRQLFTNYFNNEGKVSFQKHMLSVVPQPE